MQLRTGCMLFVVLSFVALGVGALLAPPLLRRPALFAATDGFVLVALGGLILFHVLPQSVHESGGISFALLGLGALAPLVVEKLRPSTTHRAPSWATFVVALAGIAAHAALDGLAFVDDAHGHSGESVSALGLAVLLHRVPVGLSLVWVVLPHSGRLRTALMAAVLFAFTVVGYVGGEAIVHAGAAPTLALVQIFVAGSVMHVLVAHRAPVATDAAARGGSLAGAAAAALVLWALAATHPAEHEFAQELDFAPALFTLLRESAPALLVSSLVVGALHAALYATQVPGLRLAARARASSSTLSQAFLGTAVGLPTPLCACAVQPLSQQLLRRGVPPAAALAFWVAAPELGVPALFLSLRLLGAPLTLARALGAALLAIAVALTASRFMTTTTTTTTTSSTSPPLPLAERARAALRYGFIESVDHTAPWLLLGLVLGAMLEPLIAPDALAALPAGVDVATFALAGVPLSLSAAGLTPFVAVLAHKGVSLGAIAALLWTGPALNLTALRALKASHGVRVAFAFAGVGVAVAVAAGCAINGVIADGHGLALHAAAPLAHGHSRGVEEVATVLVLALWAASLWRQGVRGFVGQVVETHDHDDDGNCVHEAGGDHVHGPHCNHNHGAALAPPVSEIAAEHLRFTGKAAKPARLSLARPPASTTPR